MKVNFLDCTIRDGGYYNLWDFPIDLVNEYLAVLPSLGVTTVELGLRSKQNNDYRGPFAFTKDSTLEQLDIPNSLEVAVMINAKEVVSAVDANNFLDQLLPSNSEECQIDLIRIACHHSEFLEALKFVPQIRNKGYKIAFNIMQASDLETDLLAEFLDNASNYNMDALYFADSLGSMNPEQVAKLFEFSRAKFSGSLGFHAHDNLGLALQNSLAAIENGATWIDATITGMGRGPGNTKTEEIALELAEAENREIQIGPTLSLIENHFSKLQLKYQWGKNIYYYLSGKKGIHPSYVQFMLADSRYSSEDILAVLQSLPSESARLFDANALDNLAHFYPESGSGDWRPNQEIHAEEILIIGPGPSVEKHAKAISRYIETKGVTVIVLNADSCIEEELIDYRAACHPFRIRADSKKYCDSNKPLICPYSLLPEELRDDLSGTVFKDFSLKIDPNRFAADHSSCILPTPLVFLYALGICESANCQQISLVGFDGYEGGDPRNNEMNRYLELVSEHGNLNLVSLTPSLYNIPKKSIYEFV